MGINHLQLSPELITALYPEALVNVTTWDTGKKPSEPKRSEQAKKPGYPFLGKNLQSICFLVSCPDDEFMPEEQLAFLQRILAACKCSLDDIALINTKQHPIEMETLKKQLHPRILFLWGARPAVIGIGQQFPDLAISTWEEMNIVPVLQAGLMIRDNPEGIELKRRLWIILKKLFNL